MHQKYQNRTIKTTISQQYTFFPHLPKLGQWMWRQLTERQLLNFVVSSHHATYFVSLILFELLHIYSISYVFNLWLSVIHHSSVV